MALIYQDTVRGAPRDALSVPAPNDDVLREQFAQTFEENPIMAFRRWNELSDDHKTGPMLPAEDARQKLKDAGLESDLKVSDGGITQAALDTLMFRKRIEKRRQETFARAEGGVGQWAARFGLSVATTFADPISAGLNFVPVVGQVRYARWLAGAGSLASRIGVRAGVGAIEGVAGAAIAEPFIYGMRTQEQADYDSADSLLNVAFGGVAGSGLHVTVGSLGELIARSLPSKQAAPRIEPTIGESRVVEPLPENIQRAIFDQPRAADVIDAMTPEAQQAALRAAVGQAIEGRPINVEAIVMAGEEQQARSVAIEQKPQADGSTFLTARTDEGLVGARLQGAELRIVTADIPNAQFRGQGRGVAMYEALAAAANERGARLVSDQTVEAPAVRVYESLERRGYDVQRNPAAKELDGDTPGLYAPEGQSVFTVGPKRSTTPNRTAAPTADVVDPEYRAASQQAEATLAREVENTTEANLKAAEEEAELAVAEAKELADRLGVNMADDADIAAINEAADKAERWARAAELATVCLTRGG